MGDSRVRRGLEDLEVRERQRRRRQHALSATHALDAERLFVTHEEPRQRPAIRDAGDVAVEQRVQQREHGHGDDHADREAEHDAGGVAGLVRDRAERLAGIGAPSGDEIARAAPERDRPRHDRIPRRAERARSATDATSAHPATPRATAPAAPSARRRPRLRRAVWTVHSCATTPRPGHMCVTT